MSEVDESLEEGATPNAAESIRTEKDGETSPHHAPGTAALAILFLVCFAVYYFANWLALADVWELR